MFPRGLFKEYAQLFSFLLRLMDAMAVCLAGMLAGFVWLGESVFSTRNASVLLLAALLTVVVFSFFHLYESVRTLELSRYLGRLLKAWCGVLVLLAGFAFLTKTGESFSRGWFLLTGGIFLVLVTALRGGILLVLRLMRARGWNEKRVVLIGAGPTAQKLGAILQQKLWTGFCLKWVFDNQYAQKTLNALTVLPVPADLDVWLDDHIHEVDEIWLALSLDQKETVQGILHQLRHHTVTVRMALDVLPMLGVVRYSLTEMDGIPMLTLNASPMKGFNRYLKACEDRVLAALMVLLALPLLLAIGLAIRLTSEGPVLFHQRRHGWDGRIINVYKFRTMHCHEEHEGSLTQARRDDKRITSLGRWLRRTSLDELPQLINVLQGRMSIVGPRPHALAHNAYYRDVIADYMQRHKVKPGITGWAQVNGWRGETDTLGKMEKRIEYDLYYIENWSLLFDLKIILMTFFRGFVGRNAY